MGRYVQRSGMSVAARVLAACVVMLVGSSSAALGAERPNFLYVMTDDQTVDSLAQMPQTQRLLVAEGTNFTNHHATQPLCCPSRASYLTGQYPHNHGVLDNQPPYGYGAMDFSRTIYTALDGAGYRTGWIGKTLNGAGDEGLVPEPGFDEWLVPLWHTEHDMFGTVTSDNGVVRSHSGEYSSDVYAERAREFLGAPGERPFLLTLALFSPHWSFCANGVRGRCPPQPAAADAGSFAGVPFPFGPGARVDPAARSIADAYWQRELESLQSVDRIVGALVEQLRAQGELENTYVIFGSDNGLEHGEHGFTDKNLPWDRSVRVPLVIRGPGLTGGITRPDLTANVDVPATILDAAEVAPPLPLDGHSLLSPYRRRALLLERTHGSASRLQQPWRQIKTAHGWTYWRDLISGRRHLYDRRRDPYQLHNRAHREPDLARHLQHRMNRMANCAAPCP